MIVFQKVGGFKSCTDILYQHAKYGEHRASRAAICCRRKSVVTGRACCVYSVVQKWRDTQRNWCEIWRRTAPQFTLQNFTFMGQKCGTQCRIFQYGGRLREFHGMSSQSHMPHCRVHSPGEINVMVVAHDWPLWQIYNKKCTWRFCWPTFLSKQCWNFARGCAPGTSSPTFDFLRIAQALTCLAGVTLPRRWCILISRACW